MERIFSLNDKECKAYQAYVDTLTPEQKRKGIEVVFHIGGGIGVGITVKCGRIKKDITDYSIW